MNSNSYNSKCKRLVQKAQKKGVELSFASEKFDRNRLDCLWYGGHVASVKVSDSLSVEIEINGDVYASLLDADFLTEMAEVRDKGNTGRFYKEMAPFIKDDKQLHKLIRSGRLDLGYNNWVEHNGEVKRDGKTYSIDLGMETDNVLDDNILLAIEQVIDNIDTVAEEIATVAAEEYKI